MGVLTLADWLASTAPGWIRSAPSWLQSLLFQLYQTFVYQNRWKFFTNGLKITFIVTIGALFLGVVIGLLMAVIRASYDTVDHRKKCSLLGILNGICKVYLTVIRGTPMMVQLLIMGFVIMTPKTDAGTI